MIPVKDKQKNPKTGEEEDGLMNYWEYRDEDEIKRRQQGMKLIRGRLTKRMSDLVNPELKRTLKSVLNPKYLLTLSMF